MTNGGPATATTEQIIPDKQLKSEGDVYFFFTVTDETKADRPSVSRERKGKREQCFQ